MNQHVEKTDPATGLRFRDPRPEEDDGDYSNPRFVQRCHRSGEKTVHPDDMRGGVYYKYLTTVGKQGGDSIFTKPGKLAGQFECPLCHLITSGVDGVYEEHGRALDKWEEADSRLGEIIKQFGFDRYDSEILRGTSAHTFRDMRMEGVDEMLSYGLSMISRALLRRSVVPAVAEAVGDLESLRVGEEFCGFREDSGADEGDDEAPFFSEAFLYPLLGKGAARTVLGYFGKLKSAVPSADKEG